VKFALRFIPDKTAARRRDRGAKRDWVRAIPVETPIVRATMRSCSPFIVLALKKKKNPASV